MWALAIEAATVVLSICTSPLTKIVWIWPIFVPRGITISVGPQFTTGIVVVPLKFVWVSTDPLPPSPHSSGNCNKKIFATSVAPTADAPCTVGVQFRVSARLSCGGILNCLSVCNAATTPAECLFKHCLGLILLALFDCQVSVENKWFAGRKIG